MKTTLKELINSRKTFVFLINLKMTSQATMFRLKRIAKQVFAALEDYDERTLAIAQEYGKMNDEGGWEVIRTPDNVAKYAAAIKDLQTAEVTIEGEQIALFDLRVSGKDSDGELDVDGLGWVTSAILTDLDWLIKESSE